MGRNTTGAITTGESLQLSINGLLKDKDIRKGNKCEGKMTWHNGANIGFKLSIFPAEYEFEIFYTHKGAKPYIWLMDHRISNIERRTNIEFITELKLEVN